MTVTFLVSRSIGGGFIQSVSRVGYMVAPQIITLVIYFSLQKYWRRFYQLSVMGRIYGSSSDHYLSNMFIIPEILEEGSSVLYVR